MQINLTELCDGFNPAERNILNFVTIPENAIESEVAKEVRSFLKIELEEQLTWRDPAVAFDNWHNAFEDSGIFVFKAAFRDDSVSGFCLCDSEFPVIYVNNTMPRTRQTFTLFHELAHLLFRTGGIDKRADDYIRYLGDNQERVEVFCNAFTGAFLVPDDGFDGQIARRPFSELPIPELAKRYSVSREVILYDRDLVSRDYYEQQLNVWIKEARKSQREPGGGDYYKTKIAYLGTGYLDLAFTKYYRNQISIHKLADYAGVRVHNIPSLEVTLNR